MTETSCAVRHQVTFEGLHGVGLVADRWEPDDPHGTVLLLHGGGQTRHSWMRTARRLAARGWRAVTVDARGHGDSAWAPTGVYRLDDMVGDLLHMVESLGEPPVVIGASMGGRTALVTAGEHPGAVAGLVLVDIAPRLDPAGQARVRAFMRGAPNGFASLEEAAEAVRAYNPRRRPTSGLEGLKKNLRLREDGRWYWHWDPHFLSFTADPANTSEERMTEAARRVTAPALLVRGRHSDMVTAEAAAELLALIPTARPVEVPAGHMIAGDDNDVFTREVHEFLSAEVERRSDRLPR
ncbi:alpha/beta fold hydrolase [Streptomyces mirabilis]|uniref:Lysophospholipase, alpha-beta hydrolase superfamily n=1 Tax=Streptomyces mirabilis TaxID=68239 RepID=A0A1I2SJU5_9ACTN|nr:alpha/beta hydrolase [Streptomyces mirabilis]SFG53155.1 Lysophospholipase, alpha-beta hydrolase superfamily [Streptomyces mirabilis]